MAQPCSRKLSSELARRPHCITHVSSSLAILYGSSLVNSRLEMLSQVLSFIPMDTPQKASDCSFLYRVMLRHRCLRAELLMCVLPIQPMHLVALLANHCVVPPNPAKVLLAQSKKRQRKYKMAIQTHISKQNFILGLPECTFARLSMSSTATALSWIITMVCPRTVTELIGP